MRIGIDVPVRDEKGTVLDAASVARQARLVEDAGLDGIWNGDGSYFRGVATEVDPLMWMAVAAVATERVELGTTVYQIPLREPVDLTQRLLSLHALAAGRFTFGVGSGSTQQGAFSAVGVPFDDRFTILYAHVAKIRRLLDGEEVDGAVLPSGPELKGGPRFVLGAWYGGRSLARAAAEYDGWMSSSAMTNSKVMAEGIRRYRDLGGARAMTTTCRIDLRAPDARLADDEPFTLLCGPEEARERLGRLAELGFDDVCLRFVDHRAGGRGALGARLYTAEDLEEIRSLVPPDPRPAPAARR